MTPPASQPQSGRLQDLLEAQQAQQPSPPVRPLQLCTYNIQDARNSRLEGASPNLPLSILAPVKATQSMQHTQLA